MKKLNLSALALSTLVLTACGGSDDSAPVPMNSATPNATTPAANTTPNTETTASNANMPTENPSAPNADTANSTPASDKDAPVSDKDANTPDSTTPNADAAKPTETTPATPTTETPAPSKAVSTVVQKFGNAFVVEDNGKKVEGKGLSVQNISQLTIDGKTYELNVGDNTDFNEQKSEKLELTTSGKALSYTKFGFAGDKETSKNYLFYQGEITPVASMPATGTASYQGYGLIAKQEGQDSMKATATFDVSFENKTIAGKLTNDKDTVTLGGSIIGNQFGGNQNGYAMTGAFFGPQADELAGRYANADNTTIGVFGAKKQ